MLDKYFGFLRVHDEHTVLESLINHNRIDEEEVILLQDMVRFMTEGNLPGLEEQYLKIRKINEDSSRIFEQISDQIIQANFDHQKQYDLLRIHQRIGSISGLIIATAKRMVIFKRIGATLPEALHKNLQDLSQSVFVIHGSFSKALTTYVQNKRDVIAHIHKVEEQENHIDHLRSLCLETLYQLGNDDAIPIGSFMVIQEIIEHLEEVSDAIEVAASSLDWLLLS